VVVGGMEVMDILEDQEHVIISVPAEEDLMEVMVIMVTTLVDEELVKISATTNLIIGSSLLELVEMELIQVCVVFILVLEVEEFLSTVLDLLMMFRMEKVMVEEVDIVLIVGAMVNQVLSS